MSVELTIVEMSIAETHQAKSSIIVRCLSVGEVRRAEQFLFFTRVYTKNITFRRHRVSTWSEMETSSMQGRHCEIRRFLPYKIAHAPHIRA